jgi:glycosyltransferase involved in cell wall biosynthesis
MDGYAPAARPPLRILVLTRSYPAAGDLYQYPFVHRRVLAYLAAGHEVAVFRATSGELEVHEFEGVTCRSGGPAEFRQFAADWKADVIAAHGLSETMWPHLEEFDGVPVRAWLHGSEIPAFFRARASEIRDPEARINSLKNVEERAAFWRKLLEHIPSPLKLVFVSHAAAALAREDCGELLRDHDFEVICNPIDTRLFAFAPKTAEQRFAILSIRPYDCRTRANDLAVEAVLRLSRRPDFGRFQFTFIGDGPLFEETLEPIARLGNVSIRRGFITQAEIAREHARHGIFLVPTRLDTQGVSRDEAMASGLVPVTSSIPVVREFVDEESAALARPDDPGALAQEIVRMADDQALFLSRSAAAADRIRRERSDKVIIPVELSLLAEAAYA